MNKSYLRYTSDSSEPFGVICSNSGALCWNSEGTQVFTGALERVLRWNVRNGQLQGSLHSDQQQSKVCVLARTKGDVVAAGYTDGRIQVWRMAGNAAIPIVSFTGHKKALTCLSFSEDGALLCSGSQGSDVLLWDILGGAGVCRLQGHKSSITACKFLRNGKLIVSSSKDTMVNVWDVATRSCIQSLPGHSLEVWSLAVNGPETMLITGSGDKMLRTWLIPEDVQAGGRLTYYGAVERSRDARVQTLELTDTHLIVQSASKLLEVYAVHDSRRLKKKRKRRKKREEKKNSEQLAKLEAQRPAVDESKLRPLREWQFEEKATDHFSHLYSLKLKHKIIGCSVSPKKDVFCVATNRNEIAVYRHEDAQAEQLLMLDLPGHRNDIRSCALNSNDAHLCTVGSGELKVWELNQGRCLQSIKAGYGLCVAFLPGDAAVAVGTKDGKIQIFNLAAGTLEQEFDAHEGAVWAIAMYPNRRGFASCSADHTVKFWDFQDDSLVEARVLQLEDEVLALCFSNDGKLIACALLNSTIAVHFTDTFKFYLSLYGHKLPVLSIDISSDNTLLVSASSDKNVKVWGLDFGDCHKSMFAHEDSVTAVRFVPRTHYFFSTGKDGTIHEWDADRFIRVSTMKGHHEAIWSLCVSSQGDFAVTCGKDRSVRMWEQSQDIVHPERERERELAELFAPTLEELNADASVSVLGGVPVPGRELADAPAPLKTLETMKAAELLMESVALAASEMPDEDGDASAAASADANPLLLRMTPSAYLLHQFERIPLSQTETALLLLPYEYVIKLLRFCAVWLREQLAVERVTRTVLFLIRVHFQQLIAQKTNVVLVRELQELCTATLQRLKHTIGFNLAGMDRVLASVREESSSELYADILEQVSKRKKLE